MTNIVFREGAVEKFLSEQWTDYHRKPGIFKKSKSTFIW